MPIMEFVLMSPAHEPCREPRLVTAFGGRGHLDVPLDRARHRNCPLINARTVYIRRPSHDWQPESCEVTGHEPLDAARRAELESCTNAPLSIDTEVVHVATPCAPTREQVRISCIVGV